MDFARGIIYGQAQVQTCATEQWRIRRPATVFAVVLPEYGSRRPITLMRNDHFSGRSARFSVSRYSCSSRRMGVGLRRAAVASSAEEAQKSVSVWMPSLGAASMIERAGFGSGAVSGRARQSAICGPAFRLPSVMMATCRAGAGIGGGALRNVLQNYLLAWFMVMFLLRRGEFT